MYKIEPGMHRLFQKKFVPRTFTFSADHLSKLRELAAQLGQPKVTLPIVDKTQGFIWLLITDGEPIKVQ